MIRVAHRRGYTVLDNTAVRHPELSFMATGVLAYLLSLPDGATMRSDRLAQLPGKEGRDAVRRCLRELEAAGFLVRERRQDERGRWYTVQTIFEVPVAGHSSEVDANPQVAPETRSQASVGKDAANTQVAPETDFQASENQASENQASVDRTSVDRTSVGQALTDQVPSSSNNTPLTPTAHAVGERSASPEVTDPHRRRRGTRADGTNPRALAQRDADTAARAEQLANARTYGTRWATLDPTASEASLAEQLHAESARDARAGWDEERIAAAVAAFAEARRTSEPADAAGLAPREPEIPPGPGSELAARAARLAERALGGHTAHAGASPPSAEATGDGQPT